jgi:hypothetical protein
MPTREHRATLALLLLFASLMPHPVMADDGPSSTAADTLFREGKALMEAKKPEEACRLFAESHKLEPAGGTLLNLATCYRTIERYASAERALREAAELAEKAGRTDAISFIRDELAALEAKVSILRIDLPAGTSLAQITLVIDGKTSTPTALTTELRVDAGEHRIDVEALGRPPLRRTVTATIGETATLDITLPPIVSEAPPRRAAIEKPEAPPAASPTSPMVPVGIVGLIVGGVAGVGGVIAGGLATSEWSDATARCPEVQCSDAVGVAASESARLFGDTSTGLLVSGGIVAAVGGALLIAGRLTEPSATAIEPWVMRF